MEYESKKEDPVKRRERMRLERELAERETMYCAIFQLAQSSPLREGETLIQRYDALCELRQHHRAILAALSVHGTKHEDNEHPDH